MNGGNWQAGKYMCFVCLAEKGGSHGAFNRKAMSCAKGRRGGLPAGTIERARLTAMWAAGEVPGSEGKPPKRLRPSVPFTEWKRFTRNRRQKSNVPCRDGDFWRFAFQTRTAARAHHAVALPCPNGLGRQTAVTWGSPTTASGPPPHCGGEAFGIASNRLQNRPHPTSLRSATSHGPNRPVLTGKCPLDIFPGVRPPKGEGFWGPDCHVASLLAMTRRKYHRAYSLRGGC